jgi:hypothetical protein
MQASSLLATSFPQSLDLSLPYDQASLSCRILDILDSLGGVVHYTGAVGFLVLLDSHAGFSQFQAFGSTWAHTMFGLPIIASRNVRIHSSQAPGLRGFPCLKNMSPWLP